MLSLSSDICSQATSSAGVHLAPVSVSSPSSQIKTERSLLVTYRNTVTDDTSIPEIGLKLPPVYWQEVFLKCEDEFVQIQKNIYQLDTQIYYPLKQNLFKAFDLTPLSSVKVVILGQDPYHTMGENGSPQANGLSFSTSRGCKIQPSLANVFKELKQEYPNFVIPNHGDLTNWAYQGVLLLNSCLTVSPSLPGSHKAIWNGFIGRILEAISAANPNCIYLLWGAKAQFWVKRIGQKSIKLLASHPSPFSANKSSKDSPAFIGCNHFRMANEYLVKMGQQPIDWCNLD